MESMDYEVQSDVGSQSGSRRATTKYASKRGGGMSGVKEQAVGQTAQKSQQGTGNGTTTFVADTQTNTVTYNFNF